MGPIVVVVSKANAAELELELELGLELGEGPLEVLPTALDAAGEASADCMLRRDAVDRNERAGRASVCGDEASASFVEAEADASNLDGEAAPVSISMLSTMGADATDGATAGAET